MKASSRAFATAQAFFWALPLLAPFCIVFALLSYQFGLLGDDGGAAISVPVTNALLKNQPGVLRIWIRAF